MSTLKELIESNRRLADSTLGQSAAINKLAAAFDRLQPSFEQIRRDLYDIKNEREIDNDQLNTKLGHIDEKLAVIADNVKSAQGDVKELVKDVTGSHLTQQREPKKPKVVEIIEAVERLSVATKILLFVLLVVAALSGWLTHLL